MARKSIQKFRGDKGTIHVTIIIFIPVPSPPEDFKFSDRNETMLKFTWRPGDTNDDGLSYVLHLNDTDTLNTSVKELFHEFNNLSSGTSYNASLVAQYIEKRNGTEIKLQLQSHPTIYVQTYTSKFCIFHQVKHANLRKIYFVVFQA